MLNPIHPILLVDDEPHILTAMQVSLRTKGLNNVIRCQDSREVMTILQDQEVSLILLDLILPFLSGQQLLPYITRDYPDVPVIVVTGLNEVHTAVSCMRHGAFDYMLKPVELEHLFLAVQRGLEVRQLRRQNNLLASHFLSETLENPESFSEIVTQDRTMRTIFQYCEAVAEGRQPVLICGETGVGKELIAKALHQLSGRAGNFVAVNVAGLDDTVFSDTLFGHAKGAFTGADRNRSGLVEKAAGGTLFLDEIGDLREASQVKLLRFLEENEYFPLGSDQAKKSEARILAATHADLNELRVKGAFRQDLYFRFKTHQVEIPPLRERQGDIPLLIDHFLGMAAQEFGKKPPACHDDIVEVMRGYSFPGNVRELKSMIFDAVSSQNGKLLNPAPLYTAMGMKPDSLVNRNQDRESQESTSLPTLKEATLELINKALDRAEGNQRSAARMLGITPQALSQRLKRQSTKD